MKTVVIGIRKLIRCSWHACFFFFFRWMDSDCDGLSYFSCHVSVSLYIASKCTNSIFKSAEPTATKWSILLLAQCDSQATVKHQPLHMWASRERWLASCHQFNSGSKIVLFMCLFPYWFDCWFGLNGLGLDLDCDATNKSEYEYKSTVCALSEHRPESTCRYVSNQIDDQHCDSQQRHLTKSTCTQNMQQTHSKF